MLVAVDIPDFILQGIVKKWIMVEFNVAFDERHFKFYHFIFQQFIFLDIEINYLGLLNNPIHHN